MASLDPAGPAVNRWPEELLRLTESAMFARRAGAPLDQIAATVFNELLEHDAIGGPPVIESLGIITRDPTIPGDLRLSLCEVECYYRLARDGAAKFPVRDYRTVLRLAGTLILWPSRCQAVIQGPLPEMTDALRNLLYHLTDYHEEGVVPTVPQLLKELPEALTPTVLAAAVAAFQAEHGYDGTERRT